MDLRLLVRARQLGATGEGRRLRERAGLSLQDVAEAVGVDAGTVSRWERGQGRPNRRGAVRWAEALATAVAALDEPQ